MDSLLFHGGAEWRMTVPPASAMGWIAQSVMLIRIGGHVCLKVARKSHCESRISLLTILSVIAVSTIQTRQRMNIERLGR
jgi:hypothetical protein